MSTTHTLSIRLSEQLAERLGEEARLENRPRSELVREALEEHLRELERARFLAEMTAEARQLSRAQTAGVAEAFLDSDNHALRVAESAGDGRAKRR